jgi:hypothetical protein
MHSKHKTIFWFYSSGYMIEKHNLLLRNIETIESNCIPMKYAANYK